MDWGREGGLEEGGVAIGMWTVDWGREGGTCEKLTVHMDHDSLGDWGRDLGGGQVGSLDK